MLIYVNITDRQTDKHIKTIVRNLTIYFFIFMNRQIDSLFKYRKFAIA